MIKILIVDDDGAVLKQLKEMAENRGYEVETAVDENDAGAKIKKKEYDVVITDMRMKKNDSGVIVVKKVKEKYPLTQVIVLTAYDSLENAVICMKEGAFSYVEKKPSTGDPYEILFLWVKRALEYRENLPKENEPSKRQTEEDEDFVWLSKNISGIQKEYRGKWIAVVNKKVFSGETATEAYQKAKETYPDKNPLLDIIPREGGIIEI